MYIQEISQQFHISKKAINLYEEKGLIKPQKDEKGYRDYSQKDIQRLLIIKQLRNLDFSIQEINNIINNDDYEIFDKKIQEYQKKYYELDTSLQYITEVKELVVNKQDITELSNEMDQTYDLKNIDIEENVTYPFDAYIFYLMTFAIGILTAKRPDDIYSVIAFLVLIIAGLLSISQIQVLIYRLIKKIKK